MLEIHFLPKAQALVAKGIAAMGQVVKIIVVVEALYQIIFAIVPVQLHSAVKQEMVPMLMHAKPLVLHAAKKIVRLRV